MRASISGVIFSDKGEASSFMALDWVQRLLREALGFLPYPATLNLRLDSEGEIEIWRRLRGEIAGIELPPPQASFCRARCFPVEIEKKLRGAVLLPDVRDYPRDKVEVIAPVRLKEALQVGDGERITLEFVA